MDERDECEEGAGVQGLAAGSRVGGGSRSGPDARLVRGYKMRVKRQKLLLCRLGVTRRRSSLFCLTRAADPHTSPISSPSASEMPATRSRTSTEQPAEVAAEEVKSVQAEDGTDIVAPVPVPAEVVKAAEAVVPESESVQPVEEQPAAEPVVPAADAVVTNGSAEPVAETNGSSEATNGSAVVTNGSAAESVAAVDESVPAAAESAEPVSDISQKRKSEVGDGDVVPDSTDVKKQKVVSDSESAVAEEPVVDATA